MSYLQPFPLGQISIRALMGFFIFSNEFQCTALDLMPLLELQPVLRNLQLAINGNSIHLLSLSLTSKSMPASSVVL
jgi:hypothetical protein